MSSLSRRVRRRILVTASLVVVPLACLCYGLAGSRLDRLADDVLRQDARALGQSIGAAQGTRMPPSIAHSQTPTREASDDGSTFAFQWWDDGNRLALGSSTLAGLSLDGCPPGFSDASIGNHHWRVLTVLDANRHWLRVAERDDARTASKRALLIPLLGFLLIAVPLVGTIGGSAVKRALRPLRMLAERIGERRPGQLASIGNDALPDELDPLIASVNGLLGRLRTVDDGRPNR